MNSRHHIYWWREALLYIACAGDDGVMWEEVVDEFFGGDKKRASRYYGSTPAAQKFVRHGLVYVRVDYAKLPEKLRRGSAEDRTKELDFDRAHVARFDIETETRYTREGIHYD